MCQTHQRGTCLWTLYVYLKETHKRARSKASLSTKKQCFYSLYKVIGTHVSLSRHTTKTLILLLHPILWVKIYHATYKDKEKQKIIVTVGKGLVICDNNENSHGSCFCFSNTQLKKMITHCQNLTDQKALMRRKEIQRFIYLTMKFSLKTMRSNMGVTGNREIKV